MRNSALVLVIDDDRVLLARLGEVLRECAMEPRLVSSLDEAFSALGEGCAPDAIVVDLDMHEPAALARIQRRMGIDEVPVLAVGSRPDDLLAASAADAIVLKPVEVDVLRRRLTDICDRAPMQ